MPRQKISVPSKRQHSPDHFLNRELSWLQFNRRVFAQAQDKQVPLLERLRYLCIVSSNLDEFFEVRVAGLKERVMANSTITDSDGHTPEAILHRVQTETHDFIAAQYELLNKDILPAMEKEGIVFLPSAEWTPEQLAWIRDFFLHSLLPVLTPIALDPAHPFPRMLNKSLNFVAELDGKDGFGRTLGLAIVQAPRALPRFIAIPPHLCTRRHSFAFLSSIIHNNVAHLFPGITVKGFHQFRVTRNSELFVDKEEVKDLRQSLQGELPQRHYGDAVRLEIFDSCSDAMVQFLMQQFSLQDQEVYRVPGPVNLVRLMSLPDSVDLPHLLFPKFQPLLSKRLRKNVEIFTILKKRDLLFHHPYQSFTPILDLINDAANDPQMVAIKMTIYRTGADSQLMESLIKAARRGKEVTVVLELLARFDEEANINWATRLEEAGAYVVYGVFGFKTHAKMLLLIRNEDGILRRYAHLSTGNYHARTARLYTDFGFLTADESLCQDVQSIFRQLTGLSTAPTLSHLWQSPFNLHGNLIKAINQEAQLAAKKKPAHIIIKVNALLEPEVIESLYHASRAGVKIDLIVRGACILRPGIKGLSENIRVISVIGRFLEHSRVFYFHANGKKQVYLTSADCMERNFFRRVELCVPIKNQHLKKRIIDEALTPFLHPQAMVWEMNANGDYQLRGTLAHHPQMVMLAKHKSPTPAVKKKSQLTKKISIPSTTKK